MPLPKVKRRLYAYPETEVSLGGTPQPDGGLLLEFEDDKARAAKRLELLDSGVVCDVRPVPAGRLERWRSFLSGGESSSFALAPLLLGPFWYASKGLWARLLVASGAALALQAAQAAAMGADGLGGPLLRLNLGALDVVLGYSWAGWAAVCLYAGFFGERDLYANAVERKSPEPWTLACAVLAAFAFLMATAGVNDSVRVGSGAVQVTYSFSRPLWAVLSGRGPDIADFISAQAGEDAASQSHIGGVLVRAAMERGPDDPAGGRRMLAAGESLLKKAAAGGDQDARALLAEIDAARAETAAAPSGKP